MKMKITIFLAGIDYLFNILSNHLTILSFKNLENISTLKLSPDSIVVYKKSVDHLTKLLSG